MYQSGGRSLECKCACSVTETKFVWSRQMAGKIFKSLKLRRRRTPHTDHDQDTPKIPKVIKYAKQGRFRKLVEALDGGEHVNSVDLQRRSALFHAAVGGHKKCLKELLKRGANPNL